MKGNARADKHGRADHDFGIGVNDALQIFDCHNMAKIPLPAELSPANMAVGRAAALPERIKTKPAGRRTAEKRANRNVNRREFVLNGQLLAVPVESDGRFCQQAKSQTKRPDPAQHWQPVTRAGGLE